MKTRLGVIVLAGGLAFLLACLLASTLLGTRQPAELLNTTRASAALTTATISGAIRHNGSPAAGVNISLLWNGGSQAATTGPSGTYSVSGVPMGSWLQVFVRPPIALRLAFRNWGTDSLAGNLTKDFDLESGYRLQGEFRQPDGRPYTQTFWLDTAPVNTLPPEGEWYGATAVNGQFDLVVAPDLFVLNSVPEPLPYHVPHAKFDLRTADQTGVVMTLLSEHPIPFSTTPPRASLISVSAPDVDGNATVIGGAGSVPPLAAVVLANLRASNMITATANASGAFTATLYAPPGSSLLIKYDEDGRRVAQMWREAFAQTMPSPTYLNPLPGTIIHVGPPPIGSSTSQAFRATGAWLHDTPTLWAGWWLSGTLQTPIGNPGPGLTVVPSQVMTLSARLRATSPALSCTGSITYTPMAHLDFQYLFKGDGRALPWSIWFNSHLFTPTGLPIEHEAPGESRSITSAAFTGLTCLSEHTFEGSLQATFTVPNDLPEGRYLPVARIDSGNAPLADDVPLALVWYSSAEVAWLPPLRLGEPAAPRIPWVLLGDYPVNGHRGVLAFEDVARYAMPTRVVNPPQVVVVPKDDERTGQPIAYRLEPGSNWLSSTDRRLPCAPYLPLKFPSGSLTLTIHKPDGQTETIGPATLLQSSVRTPTTPGGSDIDGGTGHIGDLYHLATLDDAFAYRFDQYGWHNITINGTVDDVYGNTYPVSGTYEVVVARVLDLDPAQLPTTPYQQGDAFAPGLHVFPPVPANVSVKLTHLPYSDPAQARVITVTGQANRFGYFQPPIGTAITLTAPGEFRVDILAEYVEPDGTLWVGAMTWGNVVEGPSAMIEAHGRRGMDYKSDTIDDMSAWFEVFNLPSSKVGIENYYPYFSGDIHWGNEDRQPGDSIHSIITIKDKTPGQIVYNLMRANYPRSRNGFRWPPLDMTLTGLDKRIAIGEAPLFMSTASGIDPEVEPEDIDQLAYWYGSSERADVRVREILSEDNMGTAYWRFGDTYGYQIGEGAAGDLPGDLKWEFGGAVFRVLSPTNPINEYAIYSSLWVLLPDGCDAYGCARVTPPFQDATGASINGGPIMRLQGQDIDMLFLPKGIRPGDVLEVGDVIAFSGHVGPPLDSRVSVTITSPSGVPRQRTWHANKIGWLYDPSFDFVANEVGRWTVDVFVIHDRPYVGNGATPLSHNTGTVLGTSGRFEFYVVAPNSPRLFVYAPALGFITWPSQGIVPIHLRGAAPPGTTAVRYTIHDKGVVMGQGSVTPNANGAFTITYDAVALNAAFPFVSLTAHEGLWEGLADEVEINLMAVGGDVRANTVTLIGEEVFIGGILQRVYLPLVLK